MHISRLPARVRWERPFLRIQFTQFPSCFPLGRVRPSFGAANLVQTMSFMKKVRRRDLKRSETLIGSGDEATHKALQTGYPRFVYHRFVRKVTFFLKTLTQGQLFDVCRDKFAQFDETCMVFPSRKAATQCKAWIKLQSPIATVRVVEQRLITENVTTSTECMPAVTLYIVVLPLDAARIAKTFWQHSGNIITSRQAEHCLSLMNANERVMLDSIGEHMLQQRARNPLYFAKGPLASSPSTESSPVEGKDLDDYVEQRFGRILDVSMADKAKRLLRRRIAGVVSPDQDDPVTDPVDRGVVGLTEDHVYLLPCGMNAIFTAFVIASRIYPQRKSVQFGCVLCVCANGLDFLIWTHSRFWKSLDQAATFSDTATRQTL